MAEQDWKPHVLRCGNEDHRFDDGDDVSAAAHRRKVEPWLAALLQAEHVNLLIGSGFTIGVAHAAGADAPGMGRVEFDAEHADLVDAAAARSAERIGRGAANIEDQIRCGRQLLEGLKALERVPVAGTDDAGDPEEHDDKLIDEEDESNEDRFLDAAGALRESWATALNSVLREFMESILTGEASLAEALEDADEGHEPRRLLASFLLTFASRAGSRERLHLFTTNYDRLIEYGCDLLGLRIMDRFVGTLAPVFRSSRLGVDLHYNPPGIRGEPRYLEGVLRLTKLHGSVDWHYQDRPGGRRQVVRNSIPFGADLDHPDLPDEPLDSLMIYPNPAKDIETLHYPYADLFRDFAAATCRPNSVLITYGYGFGDDHINRVIRDMMTIPSTHLAVISFDDASGRIPAFLDEIGKPDQTTLLLGSVFGELENLVDHLLPKPAIDRTTWTMMELLKRRANPEPPPRAPDRDNDEERVEA